MGRQTLGIFAGRTTVGKSLESSEHGIGSPIRSLRRKTEARYQRGEIPPFRDDGFLPVGIHLTKWDALTEHYGTNAHRAKLLDGLLDAAHDLKEAGVKEAYIGGSFVTKKEIPGDFDLTMQVPIKAIRNTADTRASEPDEEGLRRRGGRRLPGILSQNNRVIPPVQIGIVKLDLDSLPARVSEVSPAKAIWDNEGAPNFNILFGSSNLADDVVSFTRHRKQVTREDG